MTKCYKLNTHFLVYFKQGRLPAPIGIKLRLLTLTANLLLLAKFMPVRERNMLRRGLGSPANDVRTGRREAYTQRLTT